MKKKITAALNELSERIGRLEAYHAHGSPTSGGVTGSESGYCDLPNVPRRKLGSDVSPYREGLIRYLDRKWVNGTKLRYAFMGGNFDGPESEKALVRQGFQIWADVGIGLTFEEVRSVSEAEIRISFVQSGRTWSYVGRDVIDLPGQNEPTMNFGWEIAGDRRGVDVPVHEIGHTLGFPHEHQNPFAGIVWDRDAVYAHFAQQGWDEDDTNRNVLNKHSTQDVEGSDHDPDSIMHYGFPAGLILQPERFRNGLQPTLGLTDTDREEVRRFYPELDPHQGRVLLPFQLETLSLEPGEQANFVIEPTQTRQYTMQTFGQADTVMVLFEDLGHDLKYIAGDDDSGYAHNASIQTRLYPGRRYILRVRLYLSWASAQAYLMLW